jgi:DNA-binding transcriptional MerR regulator
MEARRACRISEVTRELGISAKWLRKGEERGYFPPARRDPRSGQRYYTRADIEHLRGRRTGRHVRG